MKILYYDRSLSIETGSFILDSNYKYVNLSFLSPAKIDTFYSKDFISKAGFCQGILKDIIERVLLNGQDPEESFDDSNYNINIYKNGEFMAWKLDQK